MPEIAKQVKLRLARGELEITDVNTKVYLNVKDLRRTDVEGIVGLIPVRMNPVEAAMFGHAVES